MFTGSVSDLDTLVLRCRNPKAKSYLAEAVTCIKAGAFRAAIVATWVAVVHDILAKLEQLAIGGDRNAHKKIDIFRKIVTEGDVKASLEFERTILDIAQGEFELIGPIAHTDLTRLHDDRHRCAHPSMVDADTDYQPAPELARTHVVNAVTHLLEHGPAQGKAALERLVAELETTYFPSTVDELLVHLEHGPLGHPRASLVRNFLLVLVKRLFETPPEVVGDLLAQLRARSAIEQSHGRILLTLRVLVRMHREVSLATFADKLDDLVARVDDDRLTTPVKLCSTLPDLWPMLSAAQKNRLSRFVSSMPPANIPKALPAAWSVPELRPIVEERLAYMTEESWQNLAKVRDVPEDWVAIAVRTLTSSKSWDDANPVRHFPCSTHRTSEGTADP